MYPDRPRKTGRHGGNGHAPESTPEEKICQVVETKRQWIIGKMNHPQKYRDLPHPPGKELVNSEFALYLGRHYRIEVAKIIPRVKHHARELGVTYAKVKIVDNLYRWGSCTVKNNVNFNWRLIKAPMFVIDYAIVHELAHLIEANHTSGFWNIIRAQAPTMEKAKAWLKENGQLLEQAI